MNQTKLTITERKLIKIFDRPSIRIRIARSETNQGKYPLILDWPNFYEPWTIEQILELGYNWGIRCGKQVGNYYFVVIDLDDLWAKERLKVNRYVKTANGIHVYCLIKELVSNLILVNQQQKRLGELQSLGKQVVGIGSTHQSGVRYSLRGKNNSPWFLKFENLKDLENFLNERGIYQKKSAKLTKTI
jgi:hypothetical protein